MATVKDVRKTKGSKEKDYWYEWDIECNSKIKTFHTNPNGTGIWQQRKDVDHIQTQITASAIHRISLRIDANTNEDDIKKQVQVLANTGLFDSYFQ